MRSATRNTLSPNKDGILIKVFRVADRMNARYGFGRIDIWMPGPRVDAIKFGVKRADIEIYYPETKVAIAK